MLQYSEAGWGDAAVAVVTTRLMVVCDYVEFFVRISRHPSQRDGHFFCFDRVSSCDFRGSDDKSCAIDDGYRCCRVVWLGGMRHWPHSKTECGGDHGTFLAVIVSLVSSSLRNPRVACCAVVERP